MVPDLKWLEGEFTKFNTKYFQGKIPTPKFSYRCPANDWGRYYPDALYSGRQIVQINSPGELGITKLYDRSEKAIQRTLLHEMIHMYIWLVEQIRPRLDHGFEFNRIANMLNQDGWQISRVTNMDDDDVYIGNTEAEDAPETNMNGNQNQDLMKAHADFEKLASNIEKEIGNVKQMLNVTKEDKQVKKLVISEQQEKFLISILKESNMPVDKKMNKPYCIDPQKVLLLKKRLDKEFIPLDYERLKGGKAECIKIAGRLTPKTKQVIEQLYEEDLADWAADLCKNMFLDKDECEKFAKLVVNRWLNNKIGVHGMLDVNSF